MGEVPGLRILGRNTLPEVVAELAIALVLVVGAGLMLQGFWRLSQQDPGFQSAGVLTFRASAPEAFYPETPQRERLTANIIE